MQSRTFGIFAIAFVLNLVGPKAQAVEKYFNPVDYGAKEGADHTQPIQAAVDAAILSGGGTIVFPRGTHWVKKVCLAPGITLLGEGGIVRRPANQPNGTRTFVASQYGCPAKTSPQNWPITYRLRSDTGVETRVESVLPARTISYGHSADQDSAPLVFRKMVIDGNRKQQGPYDRYELEQSHLLMLSGDPNKRGRINVLIEDSLFADAVADAISVYVNSSVVVRRTRAHDVFRGGLVVTGGYTKVILENFSATGSVHNTGIDVEVTKGGVGYGGTKAVDFEATDVHLQGDFDIGLKAGSRFKGTRIRSYASPFNLNATQSVVEISDSLFTLGNRNDRITRPGQTKFKNTTFVIKPDASTATDPTARMLVLFNNSYSDYGDQTLEFDGCRFVASPTSVGASVLQALEVNYVKKDWNNQVIMRNSEIGYGFRDGLYFPRGADATIANTINLARNPIVLLESADYPITKFLLDGKAYVPTP